MLASSRREHARTTQATPVLTRLQLFGEPSPSRNWTSAGPADVYLQLTFIQYVAGPRGPSGRCQPHRLSGTATLTVSLQFAHTATTDNALKRPRDPRPSNYIFKAGSSSLM